MYQINTTMTNEYTLQDYEKEYIHGDDDVIIYAKIPTNTKDTNAVLKSLEEYKLEESFLRIIDEQEGENLLKCRITNVNGALCNSWDYYRCDYCNSYGEDTAWYCLDCHKDMCKLCYSETSEEIALANGAKNYHERKDALEKCRSHRLVEKKKYNARRCNSCDDEVINKYYTNTEKVVCFKCSLKDNTLIKDLTFVDQDMSTWLYFGSMMDWIPIIKDYGFDEVEDGENMILYNINKDSPYYEKYCLAAMDDHGRTGFFITNLNLQEIMDKIKELYLENKKEIDQMEGWDRFYSMPINLLMEKLNIPTYYG